MGVKLAKWEDENVQKVYEILCDNLEHKPMEEHWEGYCARWIVAALVEPLEAQLRSLKKVLERTEKQRDDYMKRSHMAYQKSNDEYWELGQ